MAKSSISPVDVHQKVGHSAFLDLVQTKLLHKALDQIKNLLCQIIHVIEGPSAQDRNDDVQKPIFIYGPDACTGFCRNPSIRPVLAGSRSARVVKLQLL